MAETVVQIISNVGFPIAVTVALAYYIIWEKKRNSEIFKSLRESIDANTKSIEKLLEKIDRTERRTHERH